MYVDSFHVANYHLLSYQMGVWGRYAPDRGRGYVTNPSLKRQPQPLRIAVRAPPTMS